MTIGTKAETLSFLRSHLPEIHILPLYILHSHTFEKNRKAEIQKMRTALPQGEWIVRSSSRQEDTQESSQAGKFTSILHVSSESDEAIVNAVEEVYASYQTDEDEEILVQPMMQDIQKSGVVFTAELSTCAPYYVANYEEGSDSAAVTSGGVGGLKTFICYKERREYVQNQEMRQLLHVCAQLEGFLKNEFLDIEFGINSRREVTIFQVRPLVYHRLRLDESANQGLGAVLAKISKKVEKLRRPRPFLLGSRTCFGVMPDWNPAEMLGDNPKTLAVTLYKELITDSVWAQQRDDYGYRDLTQQPLMVLFCGLPYIDTRVTFNSFVPKQLDEAIASKLVEYYLDRLSSYPAYHDKIEFKIVFSCYYFGVEKQLSVLTQHGFSDDEVSQISNALLALTRRIIHPDHGYYKKDLEKTQQLEQDYDTIMRSDLSTIDKIYWLLEKCKLYGTLPFAGVARAGFIAVQMLQSLVDCGVISAKDRERFLGSLKTVNRQMSDDLQAMTAGRLSRAQFLARYGHIRPGSYDITSLRYDENFDSYFDEYLQNEHLQEGGGQKEEFAFLTKQQEAIQQMLEKHGLQLETDEFLRFVREAIEGREYVKFVFMKAVSEILRLIEQLGKRLHISREDMAYLDISEIKRLYVDLAYDDLSRIFSANILQNKQQYRYERVLKLPSLILAPEDVYAFYLMADEPNFIGQGHVTAETVAGSKDADCHGKIVFVRAADPGYDYLFTKGIAGLVTQYGGANSHMAIRCAELGLPAAIGVGEQKYNEWSQWPRMELDCGKKLARQAGIL